MVDEKVKGPWHYHPDTIQVVYACEQWLTDEEYIGALKFCIITYNARSKRKGSEAEDLAKAAWYSNELSRFMKEGKRKWTMTQLLPDPPQKDRS